MVRTFARYERDEFAHTLLHAFFGLFGDFGVLGQSRLHDARDWGKVMNVSVLIEVFAVRILGAML